MSKKPFFLGIIASVFFSASDARATFLTPCPFNWGGMYIGAYMGGASGPSKLKTNVGSLTSTSYFVSNENIVSVNQSGTNSRYVNSFIGGIQGGYNWLLNNVLFGGILSFGSVNLNNHNNKMGVPYPSTATTYSIHTSIKTNWVFTAQGRLGVIPWNSAPLIYATGGLAVTQMKVTNAFGDGANGLGGTIGNKTKIGWVVGGGFEVPLHKHSTINGEYLHLNFGSAFASSSIIASINSNNKSSFITSGQLKANILKIGLNYKI